MDFRFCCPKCSSTTIYVEADPRISWEKDKIIRCYTCGWSLYGKEKAQAAVEEQYKVFLKEKRADQVHRAEAARRREIHDINAWERQHKEVQQLLISKGLCASIDCDKHLLERSLFIALVSAVYATHIGESAKEDIARGPRRT